MNEEPDYGSSAPTRVALRDIGYGVVFYVIYLFVYNNRISSSSSSSSSSGSSSSISCDINTLYIYGHVVMHCCA